MSKIRMLATPTQITIPAYAAWTDVDLSSYLSDDATGVILYVYNYKFDDYRAFGARKNGSTDNRYSDVDRYTEFYCYTGVDSNGIVEIYAEDSNIKVYLFGYFREEATFFSTGAEIAATSSYTWQTKTFSGYGSPSAIIIETQYLNSFAFRKYGSTNPADIYLYSPNWAIVPLDSSQRYQIYTGNTSYRAYIVGYISGDITLYTDRTDVTPGTLDTWTDLTALPDDALAGIYFFSGKHSGYSSAGYSVMVRENGSSWTRYWDTGSGVVAICKCDSSKIVEGYVDGDANGIYLIGYFPNVPTSISAALSDNSSIQTQAKVARKASITINTLSDSIIDYTRYRGCDSVVGVTSNVSGRMSELLPIRSSTDVAGQMFNNIKARVSVGDSSSISGKLARYSWFTGEGISSTSGLSGFGARVKAAVGNMASETAIVLGDAVMKLGARVAPAPTSWIHAWIHDGDETMTPKYTFYETKL